MVRRSLRLAALPAAGAALLAGCASVPNPFAEPDPRWADYRSWTVAGDEPSTGPSLGLGSVHKGPEGYRRVYVNGAGREMLLSKGDAAGDYDYPEGTVIVKEQYDDEAAYRAGAEAGEVDVTVSLKVAEGGARRADDWNWAAGYTAAAGPNAFCSGCHSIPIARDFVFSNANYLAAN